MADQINEVAARFNGILHEIQRQRLAEALRHDRGRAIRCLMCEYRDYFPIVLIARLQNNGIWKRILGYDLGFVQRESRFYFTGQCFYIEISKAAPIKLGTDGLQSVGAPGVRVIHNPESYMDSILERIHYAKTCGHKARNNLPIGINVFRDLSSAKTAYLFDTEESLCVVMGKNVNEACITAMAMIKDYTGLQILQTNSWTPVKTLVSK